jgi:hypothetical protein
LQIDFGTWNVVLSYLELLKQKAIELGPSTLPSLDISKVVSSFGRWTQTPKTVKLNALEARDTKGLEDMAARSGSADCEVHLVLNMRQALKLIGCRSSDRWRPAQKAFAAVADTANIRLRLEIEGAVRDFEVISLIWGLCLAGLGVSSLYLEFSSPPETFAASVPQDVISTALSGGAIPTVIVRSLWDVTLPSSMTRRIHHTYRYDRIQGGGYEVTSWTSDGGETPMAIDRVRLRSITFDDLEEQPLHVHHHFSASFITSLWLSFRNSSTVMLDCESFRELFHGSAYPALERLCLIGIGLLEWSPAQVQEPRYASPVTSITWEDMSGSILPLARMLLNEANLPGLRHLDLQVRRPLDRDSSVLLQKAYGHRNLATGEGRTYAEHGHPEMERGAWTDVQSW